MFQYSLLVLIWTILVTPVAQAQSLLANALLYWSGCSQHSNGKIVCGGVKPMEPLAIPAYFNVLNGIDGKPIVITLKSTSKPALLVTSGDDPTVSKLTDGFEIYNGTKHFMNQFSVEPSPIEGVTRNVVSLNVVGFSENLSESTQRSNDAVQNWIRVGNGRDVVAVNWMMIARNYDGHSNDAPEGGIGHSLGWDNSSVTIVPYNVFSRLLEYNKTEIVSGLFKSNPPEQFVYPNMEELFHPNFVNTVDNDGQLDLKRDVVKYINRNLLKAHAADSFGHANVRGPWFNDKPWYYGIVSPFVSAAEDKCEFKDPDQVGVQITSYDPHPFGFVEWSKIDDDSTQFVVIVQAGDGGAGKDDLVALFLLDKDVLASGNRVIYRHLNHVPGPTGESGIDYAVELQRYSGN